MGSRQRTWPQEATSKAGQQAPPQDRTTELPPSCDLFDQAGNGRAGRVLLGPRDSSVGGEVLWRVANLKGVRCLERAAGMHKEDHIVCGSRGHAGQPVFVSYAYTARSRRVRRLVNSLCVHLKSRQSLQDGLNFEDVEAGIRIVSGVAQGRCPFHPEFGMRRES